MAQAPYQPMRKPQKDVSQQRMFDILAKHSPIPVKTPQVGETPKAELPPLEWQTPVRTGELAGYVLSADGGFSVDKSPVKGVPMYSAWKRKQPAHESIPLGVRLSLAEAQHLCELAR